MALWCIKHFRMEAWQNGMERTLMAQEFLLAFTWFFALILKEQNLELAKSYLYIKPWKTRPEELL